MNRILRVFFLVQLVICINGVFGCGGDESKNECQEAKEIRMAAIGNKCAEPNMQGCCYCSCELTGAPTTEAGCSCGNWTLYSSSNTETCEGGELNKASICIGNPPSCENSVKTYVALQCQP